MSSSLLFSRPRFSTLRLALVSVLLLSGCVDAPSAPEGSGGPGAYVIAPVFSLLAPGGERPMTAAQQDALAAAFDQVDRFRMVVRRAADNVVVLDTVIVVTPGAEEYDLSVSLAAKDNEQFLVTLTAMQGATTLFTAENIPAKATPPGVPGSPPPAAVQIPLVYTGPGATAKSVVVGPTQVVLAAGGSATVGASVRDSTGAVIAGVPVAWSTSASGVATVTSSGVVTAVADGLATVTVTTPTGLAASATVYVVAGELAYVEAGVLKVRGAAGGTAADRASGGASQPAWSADGARLYYVAGGQVWRAGGPPLTSGSWPSVSPDGTKLALERGAQVWFVNDDGSGATAGPGGSSPVWADASALLVGGGSVQRVKADGTGRTTVVAGEASLPALAGDGRIASVAGGELRVTGRATALLTGATGRPTWSPNGRWLVVATASGLMLVPSDGSAAGVALPGLAGATDPAFKPTGTLAAAPSVSVTGFNPDPPIPGTQVQVLGSGFDWIIRTNNRVVWPTRDGSVESSVGLVTEGSITTTMPRNVIAGQVRVETRSSTGLLAFVPTVGSLEVTARTPWDGARAGVGLALTGPSGPLSGTTDVNGSLTFPGLIPGTYTVTVTPPVGWELVGERVRTLAIGAEAFALTLQLTPIIASVALSPAAPSVAVGGSLPVTLVVMGVDGQAIPQVQGLAWRSGSAELVVTAGSGLGATLSATFAGEGAGSSVLEVSFGGKTYTFPVTVTSGISGTILKDTGVTPPPAAADVVVQVKKGGVVVAEARTGADGRYAVSGLFRGTYDVVPQPQADLLPVPAGQTVILDQVNPTGRADFKMQSFAGLDVTALTPWNTPVSGVVLRLLNANGVEVARDTTDVMGKGAFLRLAPGTYTLAIAVPAGFLLTGDALRTLVFTGGAQSLALQVEPVVQSAKTVPEVLALEVGTPISVQLVPLDARGGIIPQVRSVTWIGGRGLEAGGVLLAGTLAATWASPESAALEFRVEINGRVFSLPVTATTAIAGTITKDLPISGADGPAGVEAVASLPAQDVTVVIKREGSVVGETRTNEGGAYRFSGLFQGTYEVVPGTQGDLSPVPSSRVVPLDETHPTGTADFHMSRGAVDSIYVTVSPDSLHALGATAQVTVQAFDTAGAPMGGRTTTYASSNPSVATVDATGKVTAVANGSAWIRTTVESKVDSVRVTVDQRAATLVLKDPKTGLPADSTQGFVSDTGTVKYEAKDARGNVVPEGHRTPTFTTSNVSVVTVNSTTGYASLVAVGTANVTATMDGVTDVMKFKVLGSHDGDLWIGSEADIAAVQAGLVGRVTGSLYIVETSLTNVNGLGSILEVLGSVYIEYNPGLANLDGLANLRYVGGGVTFAYNQNLSSISVFPALTAIPGWLTIDSGAKILGMPGLQSVEGSINVQGDGPNTVVQELRFPALARAGSVTIYGNDALAVLQMPVFQETTGEDDGDYAPPAPSAGRGFVPDLPDGNRTRMVRAAQLRERAEAAQALRDGRRAQAEARKAEADAGRTARRTRSRELSQAPMVRGMQLDLPGAGADSRRERLARRAAERSEAAPVRPKPAKPQRPPRPQQEYGSGGEVWIESNAALPVLSLPALSHVNGPVNILRNAAMASVALPALVYVGSEFLVRDMPVMTSLGVPVLETVGEYLDVSENSVLGQLLMPALRSVGYSIWVGYNSGLTSLKFPVLESTGDDVEIYGHEDLSVIEIATASTLEIGYDLYIEDNYALTSVQIPGLAYVYDDVEIYDNVINGSMVIGSAGPLELGYELWLGYNGGAFTFSAPGLNYVYDEIYVDDNAGLTSFTAATTGGPTEVNYGIYFWDNPALQTVTMPNVTEVYDWVEFGGNFALVNFNMAGLISAYGLYLDSNGDPDTPLTFAFPALESLDSDLELYGYEYEMAPEAGPQGASYPDGDGVRALLLPKLLHVGEDLLIDANDILTTLDLSSLMTVGDYSQIYQNPAITSISLPRLIWTGYDIWIEENAGLTSFSAPALQSTAGPVESLEGAPGPFTVGPIAIVGGVVGIWSNPALTSFDLSSLWKTEGVDLFDNQSIVTLGSLGSLSSGSSFYANGNAALANLNGLAGVTALYHVYVLSNPALADVSGLASLNEAYRIDISDNGPITSVSFPNLVQVWNRLAINTQAGLTSLSAPNLVTVGAGTGPNSSSGRLSIADVPALTTASFNALTTVDNYVQVKNTGLVNLNGFTNLKSPVYAVYVDANPALTDVMGLSNIGTFFANPAVASAFQVINNPQLCSDNVDLLINAIKAHNPTAPEAAFATPPVNTGNKSCGTQQN